MRMPFRHLLICTLACLALAGCDHAPPTPLRVAAHVWPGYESLYLARSLGLYDKAPIRLIETASATSTAEVLRNGLVEAAALTLDEALQLLQDGVEIKVVLVMDVSHGGDKLLARPNIPTLKALRGARVGVESGAVGALMLQAALEHAKLAASDIRIERLSVDEQFAAWQEKRVDAVVTYDPVARKIQQQGGRLLFDSRQIAGRILDVLVVRTDALERHESSLKTLIEGHFSALESRVRDPATADAHMARRLRVPAVEVASLFNGIHIPSAAENHEYLDGPSPTLESASEHLAALMLNGGLLRELPTSAGLALPSLLPKARP